ncbi:hypothetical protein [Pelagibacterium limicola]|uniref:hypothetical protein n=1 Tax=Pelagibacterium limicola TaxID=2791022 RepID=UPI0018AFD441|nr:hypothetical protein [Pelagibacterium limicola]
MAMNRSEIEKLLGPVDNQLAAEIVRTDASPVELAQALSWLHSDEARVNEGAHMPTGVVAELVDLLEAVEDEDGGSTPLDDGTSDWV